MSFSPERLSKIVIIHRVNHINYQRWKIGYFWKRLPPSKIRNGAGNKNLNLELEERAGHEGNREAPKTEPDNFSAPAPRKERGHSGLPKQSICKMAGRSRYSENQDPKTEITDLLIRSILARLIGSVSV